MTEDVADAAADPAKYVFRIVLRAGYDAVHRDGEAAGERRLDDGRPGDEPVVLVRVRRVREPLPDVGHGAGPDPGADDADDRECREGEHRTRQHRDGELFVGRAVDCGPSRAAEELEDD